MLRVGKLTLLAVLAIGCRPDTIVEAQAGEDSWTTLPSRVLQVRVSKFDGDGTVEVVAPPSLEANVPGTAKGPAVAGTKLPVRLEGVPCAVAVLGRYEALVEKSAPPKDDGVRRTAPVGTRTLRGLNVQVTCGGAPVPGTDAATVGTQAIPGIAWGLPALVLAVLAGVLARAKELGGAALGAAAGALGAAIGLGVWRFDGAFAVTYPVLFGGLAVAGMVAGHIDMPHPWKSSAVGVAGLVAGAAGVAVWHGVWSAGGPVLALIAGLGCAALGLIGVAIAAD